ncbi:MAG: DNA-processing protein DprA [Fimbriimonadales bacterium]
MAVDWDSEEDLHLALCLAPGVGSAIFRSVVDEVRVSRLSPREVFESDFAGLVGLGLPELGAAALSNRGSSLYESLDKYKKQVGSKTLRFLTSGNVLYPSRVASFLNSPPAFLFAYGNLRTLNSTTFTVVASRTATAADLDKVERAAEEGVLSSKVLVGGTNTDAYQRASVVPLRWGAPRILVLDRGIFKALGDDLAEEPFRTARLWRYRFDPETDLVISRNRPFDEYAPSNQKYRDELIVALSDEIYGIGIRPGGNMEKLAAKAEEQGKSVVRDG